MTLIAYGAQDVYMCNNLFTSVEKYSYDLVNNICDNFEFSNINFIDYICLDNIFLHINNFSKKYYNIGLNCSYQSILNIKVDDPNIKYFNCSNNPIKSLDLSSSKIIFLVLKELANFNLMFFRLPVRIIYLDLSGSLYNDKFYNFSKFKNLKYFISIRNYIKSINNLKLPKKIIYLDLTECSLKQFAIGIDKLEYLILKSNKLDTIDLLNLNRLKYLDISSNPKLFFDSSKLPSSLKILLCSRTQCTEMYNLPLGIIKLDCSHTNITTLDYLPESLEWLDCSYTSVSDLSNLPNGIKNICYKHSTLVDVIDDYYIYKNLPKKIKTFSNDKDL